MYSHLSRQKKRSYPEIEEMHSILSQITEKRDRLYHLLDTNNPDTLTKQKAQELSVEVEATARFFDDVKPRLKEIEKYLAKNTDTKLDAIWQDIETTEMYVAVARVTIGMVLQGKPLPVKEAQQAKVMPITGAKGMHELTLKVQLDGTPIYRTFKVIDRCSLFEMNMLIQFCYDWHDMNPYIFEFKEEEFSIVNSQLPIDQKTTRLSAIGLRVGDTFQFKYDMPGDKWLHTLTVEHIEPYAGKEDDYEPECISGSGPDPGEGAGGNAWVRRNLPYILRNKKKYHPFRKDLVNDSFHLWWTVERLWWIENGTIRYDE